MTGSTTSSSFIWTLLLAFFFIWNSLVLSLDLLVFSYFFASWSRTSSIYVCCIKYCCQIYESSFLQRKTIDLQAGEVSWSFYIAVKSMKTFFFFFWWVQRKPWSSYSYSKWSSILLLLNEEALFVASRFKVVFIIYTMVPYHC